MVDISLILVMILAGAIAVSAIVRTISLSANMDAMDWIIMAMSAMVIYQIVSIVRMLI